MRHVRSLWVLVLVSTLVVTAPTSASGWAGLSDPQTDIPVVANGETGPNEIEESHTSTGEATLASEHPSDDSTSASEELDVLSPIGPATNVDVPTYETVREPGGFIPSSMTTIVEDKNVQLLTFPDVDNFLAILKK